MRLLKILLILYSFFIFNKSFSQEINYFLSLKNNKVNVRYGPGFDYPIKYIYKKKFLPLRIIDQKENFRRVIDLKKNSGWIHISQLRKLNSLIVTKEKILFKNKSKFSEPLVKLNQGRLVLISKCVPSWCKVKTGNYRGWISLDNVWGM